MEVCKADWKGPGHVGVTWTVQWSLTSILAATGATGGTASGCYTRGVWGQLDLSSNPRVLSYQLYDQGQLSEPLFLHQIKGIKRISVHFKEFL